MLTSLVRTSLARPWLVLLAAVLMSIYGAVLLTRAEVEVFPEFVPAQADIQAEAPGMTATQVELLVTRPIENAINGATGVESVRSQSIQGLAVVNVVFRRGEDPYRARQVVAERLVEVTGSLPAGLKAPTISPLTSSTMDLLKIGFVSDKLSPMELEDLVEWTVRPRLLSTPGVARVNIFGGERRRLEVRVRQADLVARGVTLADVEASVQAATQVRGGGFVETEAQRVLLEPRGAALAPADIAGAPLAPTGAGSLVVGDVADVMEAATPKFGDALVMGRLGVLAALSSQFGANTLTTTRAVEAALDELRPNLEARGVTMFGAMHRPANFIETALDGVRGDLLLGAFLITLVLLALTRDLRVVFIAFVSIPLSLLAAMIVLALSGLTLNTMILGGLAVALGVVIDDAIIGVENILRRLRDRGDRPAREVVLDASVEVRAPVVYATFVLALTMAPVLLLTGLQGSFFGPLALAFLLATLASLVVAITVTPALSLLLLGSASHLKEPGMMRAARAAHADLIRGLCRHPLAAMAVTGALGLGAIFGFTQFGAELLPAFREGHYVLKVNGPSGASLGWMRETGLRITKDLLAIDGVATVEQQIGRAEGGEDTFPPNRSEVHVDLKKKVDAQHEDKILKGIRDAMAAYPGIGSETLTSLGDRIAESLSGETAAIVISIYGADLDELDRIANQIAAVVRAVPHAVDVQVASPPGAPAMAITFEPARLALRGVSSSDAYDAIEATYQGRIVAQIPNAERITDVAVTLPNGLARDPEAIGALQLHSATGGLTPLSEVAIVDLIEGRATISHDGGRRRQVVTANAGTRDIGGLTQAIRAAIAQKVKLPADVYLDYSGAAQGQAAATQQLAANVGFAAIGVIALLVLAFGGARPAILILAGAPAALAGGVVAVFLLGGGVLSLGALVGFVTLFGIAARNSILMVSHVDHLVDSEGETWGVGAVARAASERLTPIVMTALVTALGMLPLALGSGEAGREVQGPMAQVILVGLATSTLFSLLLLPPLILAFRRPRAVAESHLGMSKTADAD